MSIYCPIHNQSVVYLTCQECDEKICKEPIFYCMVICSENFSDYSFLKTTLQKILIKYKNIVIVSEETKEITSLIELFANEMNYRYLDFASDNSVDEKYTDYIKKEKMCHFIQTKQHYGMVVFCDDDTQEIKDYIFLAKIMNIPYRMIHLKK